MILYFLFLFIFIYSLNWLFPIFSSSFLASIKTYFHHYHYHLHNPSNRYPSPSLATCFYDLCSSPLNSNFISFLIRVHFSINSFFLQINLHHKIELSYRERLKRLFYGKKIMKEIKLESFIIIHVGLRFVIIYLVWFQLLLGIHLQILRQ